MPAAHPSSSGRDPSDGRLRGRRGVRLAPVAELRPRAEVLADLVEPVLDLGADGPMALAAIAELVDCRSLGAADAVLEHAGETAGPPLRVRVELLLAAREEQ